MKVKGGSRQKKHVQMSWGNRECNTFEDLNTIHHILSVEWEEQKRSMGGMFRRNV